MSLLNQSRLQLSLGMGLGLKLDLSSWHYGPGEDSAAADGASPRAGQAAASAASDRTAGAQQSSPHQLVRGPPSPSTVAFRILQGAIACLL